MAIHKMRPMFITHREKEDFLILSSLDMQRRSEAGPLPGSVGASLLRPGVGLFKVEALWAFLLCQRKLSGRKPLNYISELIKSGFKFGILIGGLFKPNFIFLGKIPELLASGVVDSATKLVLVNAIYFKGSWQEKFMTEATKDAPFRLNKVRPGDRPGL